MKTANFNRVVALKAERPSLQDAWQRQRDTAREFCRRFALGRDTLLLGDEVGMGKTYVALAVMAHEVLQPGSAGGKALLVTPPSAVLRAKWEQEVRSFSERYVPREAGAAMRPLIVHSYWDLVGNLHEHKDVEVNWIGQEKLSAILFQFWQWSLRKGWVSKRHKLWDSLLEFDEASPAAMRFASEYSVAALEAYLEKTNADENDFLHAMLKAGGRMYTHREVSEHRVKQLFKAFTQTQQSFEPNVFILGMNALRKPRSDKWENRRFSTFVLSVLLKGRWQKTCEAVVKALKKTNVLQPKLTVSQLNALAQVDLYRTRSCVQAALEEDEALSDNWERILADPESMKDGDIKNFFAQVVDATVAKKVSESGIRLAVVDEVHNWKSGANGALDFQRNFANSVPHKLLMSATPFQLGEREMETILGFAMKQKGQTHQVMEQLFGPAQLVQRCLMANKNFLAAWSQLKSPEAQQLVLATQSNAHPDALQKILGGMQANPGTDPTLKDFCATALAYRSAVDALLQAQRQIMIRHVKPRVLRRFHAGRDYMAPVQQERTALYAVAGHAAPADAFLNFLAMRVEQRVRSDGRKAGDEHSNARLVRGMSSSRGAFLESRKVQGADQISLSGLSKGYLDLFEAALERSPHPKVSATVALALQNYLHGRKTLIFCERVKTVEEIAVALRAGIEDSLGEELPRVTEIRKQLVRSHLFADIPWYRSWRRVHSVRVDAGEPAVRQRAVAFVRACMRSAPITERRVMRLLDLWFLREEYRMSATSDEMALRCFAAIADGLESDAATGKVTFPAVLNISKEGGALEDDLTESIETVLDKGFLCGTNLWIEKDHGSLQFDQALWKLVNDEASQVVPTRGSDASPQNLETFYNVLLELQTGLRKVALRQDLLRRCLPAQPGVLDADAVFDGVRLDRGGGSSVWQKLIRFLGALAEANGTINALNKTNTRRRNLWRGTELREDKLVVEIDGSTRPDSRVLWCAAFNSPLAPDVLICTAIGSEGIDLHKECAEVIHHDLPWNPARMEQRIGRLDRVGSLAEESPAHIRIGIPFLANNYDEFQYDTLLSRAQRFEVLLGTPDFKTQVDEEDYESAVEGDVTSVVEHSPEEDATSDAALPALPQSIVDWLRVDLSLKSNLKETYAG